MTDSMLQPSPSSRRCMLPALPMFRATTKRASRFMALLIVGKNTPLPPNLPARNTGSRILVRSAVASARILVSLSPASFADRIR
ncbi:MAG: hypothetical protein ACK55Z_31175 [bacterium]